MGQTSAILTILQLLQMYLLLLRSGMASPVLAPSLFDGGTYFPAEDTAPPAGTLSEGPPEAEAPLVALSSSPASPVPLAKDS
jgi:hypothetical protein